jgi:predicted aminopeptidase
VRSFTPSKLRFLFAIFLLSAFFLTSCSPLYILQAAFEEGKILWRREPIEKALQRDDLDSDARDKFKLVLAVREYARDSLKLRVGGSYATYSYIDRPVLSYVLTAAPKTDLTPYTWWFLFVGRVPYKGFFSEEDAKAEAAGFDPQRYDTYIRTSPAYSTLGWFDDPLLAHLLKYDKVTLAEVVFHELFHNTLYVGGAGDFNESLANFVGNRAAVLFFRDRYGEGSAEHLRAIQAWEEELDFSRFIGGVASSLRELYGKELPNEEKLRLREEIFLRSQRDWSQRISDRPRHRFRAFSSLKVNNAVIAHYLLYFKNLELFESVYQAEGKDLARSVELIKESVQGGGDPFLAVRELLGKSQAKSSKARHRFFEAPDGVDVGRGSG